MQYTIKWHPDLMNNPWYQNNPAEEWLTKKAKSDIIDAHKKGIIDFDSEVVVYETNGLG